MGYCVVLAAFFSNLANADTQYRAVSGCNIWHTCPAGYVVTGLIGNFSNSYSCTNEDGNFASCSSPATVNSSGVHAAAMTNPWYVCSATGVLVCAKICN